MSSKKTFPSKKTMSQKKTFSSKKKRGRKLEIVFDPDARRAHLQGFSERKKERRAFGLAMQKVKDRNSKIEQRKLEKKDELERVQEAERQKAILLEEELLNAGVLKDGDDDDNVDITEKEPDGKVESRVKQKQYDDKQVEKKWGGRVTVTTTLLSLDDISDDDDDDDDAYTHCKKKAVDHEQKKAGDVQKYLNEFKGNMPGKRKQTRRLMTKGKNGAADMKGMGGSANLRMAQKVLGKAKARAGVGGNFSKKVKKGRGKR
ncbi:MAG: hypothetical protein SGBAC_002416 [Bacillariaceae sp.]